MSTGVGVGVEIDMSVKKWEPIWLLELGKK